MKDAHYRGPGDDWPDGDKKILRRLTRKRLKREAERDARETG